MGGEGQTMMRAGATTCLLLATMLVAAASFSCGKASYRAAANAPAPSGVVRALERPTSEVTAANPGASADVVRVLRYLYALPARERNRVLSGQNVGSANLDVAAGYERFFEALEKETGKAPAILSIDYAWENAVPADIHAANALLIRHWRQGGLISLSMSPGNPWTGGGLRDMGLGGGSYLDVVTTGTAAHRRWMAFLATVADGLEELRDAGVVVLWRPLHEMNGDFFWWSAGSDGGRARPQEFRALWEQVFDYMTHERGLNNLLWVYAPNAQTNESIRPVTFYYPGAGQADVVGLDYYGNSLDGLNGGGGYDALAALGKPVALTEVGPAFWPGAHPGGRFDNTSVIRSVRERYPAVVYFVYWHGWGSVLHRTLMAIVENLNAAGLLNDPWVVTRDEVDWRDSGEAAR
jgi:mannan endo-1,4-beta-mannosidase